MGRNDRALSVLFVDDDPVYLSTIRRCTARALTFFGAENSEQALAIAEHEPLDLAMVDLYLVGPNGLRISTSLRCRFALLGIAVVTSAQVDDNLKSEAIAHGADECWEKPDSLADVLARIDALVRLRERRAESQPPLDEQNRRTIEATMRAFAGNSAKTARVLGYTRYGLTKKLQKTRPK